MQNLDNRLASFNPITKPKSKAKPQFPLEASTHPHLTPRALAEAGFYHTPGSSSPSFDNCTCFLCNLELGGWDEDDDPFEEHAKRAGCAWAEMFCAVKIEKRKRDRSNGQYTTVYETADSLPQSAESIEVRIQTFKKWWPHKQKSGWLPTVKALARAGFVYNPSTESKDAVICPYCEYGVEGWEATDDPWEIHQSKVPDCHFFRATLVGDAEKSGSADRPSKTSGRPKKSIALKKSKRGTTVAPPEPYKPDDAKYHSDAEEKTDVEKEKPNKVDGRRKKSEALKRSKRGATVATAVSETEGPEHISEEDVPASKVTTSTRRATRARVTTTTTTTTKAKTTRGKKKAGEVEAGSETQVVMDDQQATESHTRVESESDVEEPVPVKKARAKSKQDKKKPKPTSKSMGKQKIADEAESEEVAAKESGLEVPQEFEAEPPQKLEKKTRTKTAATKTKGRKKAEKSEVEEEDDSKVGTEVELPYNSEAGSPADEQLRPKVVKAGSKSMSKASSQASKSSKPSSRSKPLPSLPPSPQSPSVKSPTSSSRPLSQLDRFANIPPTSSPAPTPRGKATLRSAQPTKPSPHAALPREAMDASLTRGALAARKVVDDLFSSPAMTPSKEGTGRLKQSQELHPPAYPQPLTEQEKQMTLEDLVRAEMQRGYKQLKEEGEKMIEDWYEKAKNDRKKIESL
ncbi:hypothetical protein I307_04157 [Cryptococcus deuterogattii 99/473]|uniref:Unplaced genomic scaffold supercont1.2, whole genome shotgun sequence n=1 Tax=Cryptococcus deuterogattii Ram5 TaxID=1296110 RepID=A0A0D0TAF3_9TREE|nr:hypothetical protein I309_03815 [Cryptococcus deuterogattii LA55]KIR43022.1 hypothetical protein I313_01231 [Cryptococcus deuterogattii Ram5]KIR95394.1 hypothetical protein I304_00143 [Cryptococcus deuterogattii CBS 10090]KIY56358.1 hypothetical protein I307_04157 [Cryptococcus deuterogattii 99/473]